MFPRNPLLLPRQELSSEQSVGWLIMCDIVTNACNLDCSVATIGAVSSSEVISKTPITGYVRRTLPFFCSKIF